MNASKVLSVLLALALLGLAGLGYGIWRMGEQHRGEMMELRQAQERKLEELTTSHHQALALKQDQHEAAIKALTEEYEKKLDEMRRDERTKMATAFREFESIFDGNKRTIDYINALEARVKAGQSVSKAEVEKLAIIATGISFLQKEYRKPFQDFKELESYFAKQTADTTKPKATFGFFKRMFSREYREAEKEYYRNEGARQAYTEAQAKFATVYAAAQRKMSAVDVSGEAQVKKLYNLIEEKEKANAEDLSDFFTKAKQALRTHQDVLDFDPDKIPELPIKPQP